MNILVIAKQLPNSPQFPGCPRLYNIFRYISKNNNINLLTITDQQEDSAKLHYLKEIFSEIHVREINSNKNSLIRVFKNLIMLKPYFYNKYLNPRLYFGLREFIAQFVKNKNIDLLYVDFLENAQYVIDSINHIPLIIDAHDANSLLAVRWARNTKKLVKKANIYLEALFFRLYEKEVLQKCDHYFVNSIVDYCFLKKLDFNNKLKVIKNGVDCSYYYPRQNFEVNYNRIIFSGTMDYFPNRQGLEYFIKDIFPLVLKQKPDVRLYVVGPCNQNKINVTENKEKIVITGKVDDIRPYHHESDVYVCPLKTGTGVKNKILNAFSMGIPVVGTSISFEGIEVDGGRHCFVEDQPNKFAEKVLLLLNDKILRKKIANTARKLVVNHYDWQCIAAKVEQLCQQLVPRS